MALMIMMTLTMRMTCTEWMMLLTSQDVEVGLPTDSMRESLQMVIRGAHSQMHLSTSTRFIRIQVGVDLNTCWTHSSKCC
eukprot:11717248-Karenia_brevis.AAC.1